MISKIMKTKNSLDRGEVYKQALKYFEGDDLAANVWVDKYALREKAGSFKESTPLDMHKRMARAFARIENKYSPSDKTSEKHSRYYQERTALDERRILGYFDRFRYIVPQGSVMAMLGNPYQIGSLSNCVVLPKLYDSYGGICYADQQLAQLMKRRCGVGMDLSTLRPKTAPVENAAVSSTGASSFMERFSQTTREVAQGGRRGALMITMDIRHPDVRDFIEMKQDLSKVTGANVSVLLRDDFMQSVENESDFILRYPVNAEIPANLDTDDLPYNKLVTLDENNLEVKRIRAKDLWNRIIHCAHQTAEPGLIFWDRQHTYSPSSLYPGFENISTNPCSEIAMGNDSCRLMALNLYSCVENPFTEDARLDYDKLYEISYEAMRLMDDLVDLELESIERILDKIDNDPEPENIKAVERETWESLYETGKKGRRTGLGFTALADCLAAMGLAYDSEEALETVSRMMHTKMKAELDSSIDMALERGSFEGFDADLEAKASEKQDHYFHMVREEFPDQWARMQSHGRRNISWSTVAPTGSLSILTQSSSGMEPLYTTHYTRRKKVNPNEDHARVDYTDETGDAWQEFPVVHPKLDAWWHTQKGAGTNIHWFTMEKEQLDNMVKKSPWYGSTAPEIDWLKRVRMQSTIQKYTSHSISSTVNLPQHVTRKKVAEIYMKAWHQGLKGITVYRDGSRSGVLITNKEEKENFAYHDAPKRPKSLPAKAHFIKASGKEWVVLVGLMNKLPYEVFALDQSNIDWPDRSFDTGEIIKRSSHHYDFKNNGEIVKHITSSMQDDEEVVTRLISTALRHGADIKFIVEQLYKAHGSVVSFTKAIARTLQVYVPEQELLARAKCQDCGGKNLRLQEGCMVCMDCGSSKCS